MNDRFIRKQLFQVGQTYQIDAFNPVYLDKTGEMISTSEGRLKNWNGNLNEFFFSDEQRMYGGKVNMHHFWYNNPKQGDFEENEIFAFVEFIKETNALIDSVYKPKYYSRIGFRVQYLLKKTSVQVKEKYSRLFDSHFQNLKKYGDFTTTAVGFDIVGNEFTTKVNVNYAVRNTENDLNSPREGLLFDLDFFKVVDKLKPDTAFELSDQLLAFASENYKEILCSLAAEMGIIDENQKA